MVACSAGFFRVGESLFMFAIVVAIFDFMIYDRQRLGIVGIVALRFPPLFALLR